MKECKCGRIPPCYGGKKFRIHEELEKVKAGDETNDKVYELNKQMCDLGKTMNDPIEPCSEEMAQEALRVLGANMAKQLNLIDVEEKKTINEWKEAFAELYKAMRKELEASDLDVEIFQNEVKPIVKFNISFGLWK